MPQLPAQPSVSFQAEKDGKSNELIVLLEYGQTARLQTLLGTAGKSEATATPASLERTVLTSINSKTSPQLTSALQAPAHARYLLNVERMSDEARARGAKVNAPRERLERFMVLRYSSVAEAQRALAAIKSEPAFASVTHNDAGAVTSWTPNDPYFAGAGLPISQYQWGLHAMNFPAAWDKARGQAQIGLIESGYLGAYESSPSKKIIPHVELIKNTRLHFTYGEVFSDVTYDSTEFRLNHHALHVAGIIGAQSNNGNYNNPPNGGTTGACINCSVSLYPNFNNSISSPSLSFPALSTQIISIVKAIDTGVQILNWSGSTKNPQACPNYSIAFCAAMDYAAEREILLLAAAGNYKYPVANLLSPANLSASYPVIPVGGTEITNPSPGVVGSRWMGADPANGSSEASMNGVVAPAVSIISTLIPGLRYMPGVDSRCGDDALSDDSGARFSNGYGDGVGTCTGTSMAAPFVSAVAGLVRSVNPRLTANQTRSIVQQSGNLAANRTVELGYGMPRANLAVDAAIATNTNRLTPLFSFYSVARSDSFYTTVPQMGNAALEGLLMPRKSMGAAPAYGSDGYYMPAYGGTISSYPYFPRLSFTVGDESPRAQVWLFTTHINPKSAEVALSPIYRMSWKCGDDTPLPPAICSGRPEHIDTVLVGESEIGYFQYAGYKVDGLEGYSYPKTLPQPAGTVRLIRKYNVARDDHAIFPETAWPTMQSQGYTQNTNTTDWLGYVYPNTGSMPVIQ